MEEDEENQPVPKTKAGHVRVTSTSLILERFGMVHCETAQSSFSLKSCAWQGGAAGLVGMRKKYYDHLRDCSAQLAADFPDWTKKEVMVEARRRHIS